MFDFPVGPGTDAEVELRHEVRGFLADQRRAGAFKPACNGWMLANPDFSRLCGTHGYVGMALPREYGGHGRSQRDRYIVSEEMLAAGAPVGAHWIADRQSGPQILRHGSEALKRAALPGIARGECYFAIGMSEPAAGSDLAAIQSRARRTDGGWRLSGRKTWTTNAHFAHFMTVLFRTSPYEPQQRHAGMTQFAIELSSPGIEVSPILSSAGRHEFNEVVFDDVFVPDENVIGAPGGGWSLVLGELAFERSGPERFLTVFPLLEAACGISAARLPTAEASIGRFCAHVATLREMSLSVAERLGSDPRVSVDAAIIKDLGNALEQAIPDGLRQCLDNAPARGDDELGNMLAEALLASPSFTLRGGTPQVLRGIIAKELGLR